LRIDVPRAHRVRGGKWAAAEEGGRPQPFTFVGLLSMLL